LEPNLRHADPTNPFAASQAISSSLLDLAGDGDLELAILSSDVGSSFPLLAINQIAMPTPPKIATIVQGLGPWACWPSSTC
jgi:hypothetical protein